MSSIKAERVAASKELDGPTAKFDGDVKAMISKIRDALYCSKICSYAQGMALIGKASQTYDYGIDLGRDCPHLEGRLHHSGRFPEQN